MHLLIGRFADVIVYVNIEDINDNAPVFLKLFETMELDENVSIDHAVTVIKAQDTDLGECIASYKNRQNFIFS